MSFNDSRYSINVLVYFVSKKQYLQSKYDWNFRETTTGTGINKANGIRGVNIYTNFELMILHQKKGERILLYFNRQILSFIFSFRSRFSTVWKLAFRMYHQYFIKIDISFRDVQTSCKETSLENQSQMRCFVHPSLPNCIRWNTKLHRSDRWARKLGVIEHFDYLSDEEYE